MVTLNIIRCIRRPNAWSVLLFLCPCLALCFIAVHNFDKRPIHFIVTSNDQEWPRLTVCAVQSAAQYHPKHQVLVHSQHLLDYAEDWKQYTNIKVMKFDVDKYLEEAGLTAISQFAKGKKYWTTQLSDIMRYILLYRFGGVYLDTDIISLRPFTSELTKGTAVVSVMDPCEGTESLTNVKKVGSSVLSSSSKNPLYHDMLESFLGRYKRDANDFGLGPHLLNEIAPKYIKTGAVTVLPCSSFFKIGMSDRRAMFTEEPTETRHFLSELERVSALGVHLWRVAVPAEMRVTPRQMIGRLLQQHCPRIFGDGDGFPVGGAIKRHASNVDVWFNNARHK